MSRYSLKPLPQHSDIFEVAVGWDPALNTFFVVVFGVADAGRETDVRYWKGGQPGQVATVEELQGAVSPFAEIPLELVKAARERSAYPESESSTAFQPVHI